MMGPFGSGGLRGLGGLHYIFKAICRADYHDEPPPKFELSGSKHLKVILSGKHRNKKGVLGGLGGSDYIS